MANQINSDQTTVFNDMSFGSNHPGGCQFILGDASVRFVAQTIDFSTYLGVCSVDGGEVSPMP